MNLKTSDESDIDDAMPFPDAHGPISVEVSDTQSHMAVDPDAIARLVGHALAVEGVTSASISVAVVDDATIREINRRHLGHDWPTDVITFPLGEPGDEVLHGELVVSAELAAQTAREAGAPAWDELALYLVHGLLHLLGLDDTDEEGRAAMRSREAALLARLGLTHTFTAAGGSIAAAEDAARERERWTV